MNPVDIAKRFASGGKVTVSEARSLAASYLHEVDTHNETRRDLAVCTGGDIITITDYTFLKDQKPSVSGPKTKQGQWYPIKSLWGVDRLIQDNLGVYYNYDTYPSIKGPQHKITAFFAINRMLSDAMQESYNVGFNDGSNLLLRLASGDASIGEYDKAVLR